MAPTGLDAEADLRQRFMSKVQKGTECWQWVGGSDRHGYGIIWWDGKPFKAHRLAYLLANSNLPARLWVTHTCGNRSCVNPAHLTALPARTIRTRKRAVPPKSPTTRLSTAQVEDIRRRKEAGESARDLAVLFGVSERHVYHIAAGDRWRPVAATAAATSSAKTPGGFPQGAGGLQLHAP